jgi:hypothetical protein
VAAIPGLRHAQARALPRAIISRPSRGSGPKIGLLPTASYGAPEATLGYCLARPDGAPDPKLGYCLPPLMGFERVAPNSLANPVYCFGRKNMRV